MENETIKISCTIKTVNDKNEIEFVDKKLNIVAKNSDRHMRIADKIMKKYDVVCGDINVISIQRGIGI